MTLRVGGLTPLSSSDWPGMLVAVVFCQGCPWHCGYCHNPDLIPPRGEHEIPWQDVLAFLHRRQGLLDGVVFSGGEPTLQKELIPAIRAVRALGLKVGLHTGGMYPVRLAAVLPLVDWVGMDVKAPFADYPRTTGADGSGGRALESLRQVLAAGVDHEIRTTVHPLLIGDAELVALGKDLADRGVKHYAIQAFRTQGCQDAALCRTARRERPLQQVGTELAGLFERLDVRAA
ncbi:MAG: anaerobic ribonucleoside-triphosphate reductase activating protein [Sulfuriferula multivorans]|uniref:Anaerobic ribonucleoside-triphosphate reductase activating protein n=1 Tax=Sulfuriferula multivorans TaxID=1559896 RepID=A0A7C9JWP5_9PROT|nr:anaerobic ribonucleoside-triphosphate reductase activating protein [Sulfuriferula multivorans]